MLYARVAFDPDGGGSGRGWMAVGRSKINKKQSFANTAGQDGILAIALPKARSLPQPIRTDLGMCRTLIYLH